MNRLIDACFTCLVAAALACGVGAQAAQVGEDAVVQRLKVATEEAGRGDIAAALADIKTAMALDPNRFDAWYELGSVLGQTGDFQGAEAALRRAIQLKPDLAKAHFSLALSLIGNPQGKMDWAGAMAECREALKYQPDNAEALNLLGAGLSTTGQAEAAIPVLERAIQLSPALPEAHFNLGLALESLGASSENKDRFDRALSEYRAAVAARVAYPEAATALGNLLLRMGKTAEAEQELDKALQFNPDLTGAHYTLARILRSLNRKSEAAVEFAEAKDLGDRLSNGIQSSRMSNEGLELASKGDLTGAAAMLRQAIALKPDYGVPHYNLGLILADSGDTAGALQELSKAISLLPGQAKPWFNLGRVMRRAKDDHGALEAIAWAARLSPDNAAIRSELASLRTSGPAPTIAPVPEPVVRQPQVGAVSDSAPDHLAFALQLNAQGDYQGGAGELLRSLELQPAAVAARRSLAETYLQMGENARAILEYHKVLRSAPEDVEARIALGKALLALGDTEEALNQLRLALRDRPDSVEARAALDQAEKVFSKR
jgi:tetratricopeptide (TPR) repeat protein